MFKPKKKTYTTIEYFDIAGQSSGKGKEMDPQILHALKNADSLIVVLDGFSEDSQPVQDFETIQQDFALNDLIIITGRLERLEKELRSSKDPQLIKEKEILESCHSIIENGEMLIR